MAKSSEPVVLELAALPREQMGPFLLLGLDKAASQAEIEEHWADRVKWARRSLIKIALEDINWARDALSEPERRLKADVASINSDTADGLLARLAKRYGVQNGQVARMWQPLDSEKSLADYSPVVEIPELTQLRQAIEVPEIPQELPAVSELLRQLVETTLDPWAIELPSA